MSRKLLISVLLSLLGSVVNSNHLEEGINEWIDHHLKAIANPCACTPSDGLDSAKSPASHIIEHSTRNAVSSVISDVLNDLINTGSISIPQLGDDGTTIYIENLSLTGLETIEYRASGTGLFGLNLNLNVRKLDLTAFYRLQRIDLGIAELWGEGDATINLENVNFIIEYTASKLSTGIVITNVKRFGITVGSKYINIEGIWSGGLPGALVNEFINNLTSSIIETINSDLGGHLSGDTCLPYSNTDAQCAMRAIVKAVMCPILNELISGLKC